MNNYDSHLSPAAQRVANAFRYACIGEPKTFETNIRALANAIRQIVLEYGTTRESEWLIKANDLLDVANELEKADDAN